MRVLARWPTRRKLALLFVGLFVSLTQLRRSLLAGSSQPSTLKGCRPGGRCSVLPGAQLVPSFDEIVQSEVGKVYPRHLNLRGYNPSLATDGEATYLALRAANFTLCPYYAGLHVHANHTKPPYGSQVLLCRARADLEPSSCWHLHIDFGALRRPRPADHGRLLPMSRRNLGFEDGRSFVWQERVHLVGTVHVDRSARRAEPRMALLRLNPAAAAVESGAVLECPGLRGTQKNYMPLIVGGGLYLVIQTHPLVVGWVDPDTLECRLVQQERESQLDLRQVLTEGSFLSGGTPFVPLPRPGKFLALVHHYVYTTRRVYLHHFVVVSAQEGEAVGQHSFSLDWVSEPFRLPRRPDRDFGTQFATGILIQGGSLFISYGITDCFAALAEVANIEAQLQRWQERGLHWRAAGRRLSHARAAL